MRLIHAVSLVRIQVPRPFLWYNVGMGKHKGFTLIEVTLFLAVTAAIFIGLAWGLSNSVFQQRYTDSTQNFLEYIRSVYSKVSNPQSTGAGNSGEAIYGKLLVIGERVDLTGADVPEDEQPIFMYDVIGSADTNFGTASTAELLEALGANVVKTSGSTDGVIRAEMISPEKYDPRWGATIENPDRSLVKKSILVVRHPKSGTINTLVYDGVINVNERVRDNNKDGPGNPDIKNLLTNLLSSFAPSEVDFCVNPYGLNATGVVPRQDIRILKNARNASAVQMIDLDSDDNSCN